MSRASASQSTFVNFVIVNLSRKRLLLWKESQFQEYDYFQPDRSFIDAIKSQLCKHVQDMVIFQDQALRLFGDLNQTLAHAKVTCADEIWRIYGVLQPGIGCTSKNGVVFIRQEIDRVRLWQIGWSSCAIWLPCTFWAVALHRKLLFK